MSKYTVTIKEYVEGSLLAQNWENITDPTTYIENLTKTQILGQGRQLFPASYEFYSDQTSDKLEFENRFIQHFYFYEIGQETVGQFKWYLEDFLNTRMPYYRELYESKLSSLAEAMKNIDITRTYEDSENNYGSHSESGTDTGTVSDVGSGQTNSGSVGKNVQKQYPLNDNDLEEIGRNEIDNTENVYQNDSNTQTRNLANSSSGSNEQHNGAAGNSRTQGFNNINKIQSTKEYRDLIFSINELIFEDAKENHLFFELW